MSNIVPESRDSMMTYFQTMQPVWELVAAEVGLLPAQTDELKARLDAALATHANALAARAQSKALTAQLDAEAAALRSYGVALMQTIRSYAEQQANPEATYSKAQIPPPKPPQPAGPPSPAVNFSADPRADGTIELTWRGTVAQNASFDIERSIDGGPYAFIKNTRTKSWIDEAVPMNIALITYRIYGVRDGARSKVESTTVQFGTLPPALQAAFRTEGNISEAA